MLKFGAKYVLVYSPSDEVRYHVGTLDDNYKFITEYEGKIDNSGWEGFYAPNTLIDPEGRKIMWGWLTEASRGDFQGANGWSGAQSVPRVLTLDSDNKLKMKPIPEYKALRYDEEAYDYKFLEKTKWELKNKGRALEIEMEIKIHGDEEFSLNVLESPDEKEKTTVRFNALSGELVIDRSMSSISDQPHKSSLKGSLKLEKNQNLNLHVFVDHSIIEVFANNEVCLSTRIYPIIESSSNISIELNQGKELNIKKLSTWKMKSIW
jgi:beta-fructofuranosidase